ncbi:MAG: DUF6036 family nucleotidyltransferase [Candidatus Micrarchaeia archaeon]|jgi:hypothetical protein
MTNQKLYPADYLQAQLEIISGHVEKPVTGYMIGGCAMSIQSLKRATKDVDLVFSDNANLDAFIAALAKAGYKKQSRLTEDYEDLKTEGIYENKDGMRVDVFLQKVCGNLVLSKTMQERATQKVNYAQLTLFLASKEDILLFKGITQRQKDIDDMIMIIESGADWQVVLEECKSQRRKVAFEGALLDKLREIAARGYNIPILRELEKRNKENLVRDALDMRLAQGKTFEQAREELRKMKFSTKQIDKAFAELKK